MLHVIYPMYVTTGGRKAHRPAKTHIQHRAMSSLSSLDRRNTTYLLPDRAATPTPLADQLLRFRTLYNVTSFPFRHDLHSSSLFQWRSLLELAGRHPRDPAHLYCSRGRVSIDDRWSAHQKLEVLPAEVLRSLCETDSLPMFKRLEEDQHFAPLIRSIQAEVIELTCGAMSDDIVVGRGTLLIASPGRITAYHVDSDVNFLFQIHGAKTFSVTDSVQRAAVSHEELEQYFMGDLNAVRYDEDRRRRSTVYELDAGYGVHVPCLAPHWAQNHEAPSVALSINFDLRSMNSVSRIYRLNARLRRWGLKPRPPCASSWRDHAKLTALDVLSAHRILRH
jgi:hypothetical protein